MAISPGKSTDTSSSCSSVPRWLPPSHPHGKLRQKRHHNKSRDGCQTCRRRRVKCDEQQPFCKACLKRGLECQYEGTTTALQLYQTPSSPLSKTHLDLSNLSFFIENSLELLTFSPNTFPDSHIVLASREFPENCHTRFCRFWKSLVVPVAYAEPGILELISGFAKRHRFALIDPQDETADYLHMLNVMARIINSHSPDIVILGAMIFFAYERLNSAATGDEPADQNYIHYNAVVKVLPKTSEAMAAHIMPILNVTWKLNVYQTETISKELIQMPKRIDSSAEARQCFSDVLRSSNVRHSLERCLMVVLQYYKEVRGKDWAESKAALTILTEARYLRTALDLTFDEPRARGQSEVSTPATTNSDSH